MQAEADRHHHALRDGRGPWHAEGRPPRAKLDRDMRCGVLVVGAGITGALVAQCLTARGHDVCIVDRDRPGMASTAASTAMLLWEIDTSLTQLSRLYGFEQAAATYRQSLRAVGGLIALVRAERLACALRSRHSLYLAAGATGETELLEEHTLRQRAGLPGTFVGHRALRTEFGFDRPAALFSPGAADADPLCLSHELLNNAVARGARLFDGDAVGFDSGRRTATVALDNGHTIEADWVVLATGYVMPDIVKSDLHQITSTWAIATPPQGEAGRWRHGMLLWEAGQNYLYARTTTRHRIIVGGEDDASLTAPRQREDAMPAKTAKLLGRLEALFPAARPVAERTWSGAFGTTKDGLPLIGAVPGHPRFLAAYGYGGNGITFGFMASRLVARMIAGRHDGGDEAFGLDRPLPGSPGRSAAA